MKIVICDDCKEDLAEIERLLEQYKESAAVAPEVETFLDASQLYHKILQDELADIYILDMIMPEKTGIDIGSLLEKSGKCVVIYITSSSEFALEAYGVHAVRYLVKPVSEAVFAEAVDYAISYVKRERDISFKEIRFPIKTREGIVSVSVSDIEYIENAARVLEVHLKDENSIKSIFIRKSFDEEIREMEADRRFMRVHKSFLINMNYVKRLTQDSCYMESGKNIPISKTKAADVKKEYLKFVSEQYG